MVPPLIETDEILSPYGKAKLEPGSYGWYCEGQEKESFSSILPSPAEEDFTIMQAPEEIALNRFKIGNL
jgi:hypothetical protein